MVEDKHGQPLRPSMIDWTKGRAQAIETMVEVVNATEADSLNDWCVVVTNRNRAVMTVSGEIPNEGYLLIKAVEDVGDNITSESECIEFMAATGQAIIELGEYMRVLEHRHFGGKSPQTDEVANMLSRIMKQIKSEVKKDENSNSNLPNKGSYGGSETPEG